MIFRSETQERLLRELLRFHAPLTAAEIARLIGEPRSTVTREVRRLVASGIVETRPAGRRQLLAAVEDSPYVRALRQLFEDLEPERPSLRLARRRAEVHEVFRRHGVRNVRVFGSVARGDDGPSSDIDFVGTFPERSTLIDISSLTIDLKDLLGVEVDVITDDNAGRVMERVNAEAVSL